MINFDEMVDNYLAREHRPKGMGRYYPSEIGSCLRKIWYSYKYPQEVKPELLKIFEVGNIMHDFVVKVLQSERNPHIELVKSEFPFKVEMEDFVISGRIDNLILVKADNKEVLVEVKSKKSIDFMKEVAAANVAQLQLYMHVLGVHDGVLLYIDKTNLMTKVFDVKYNEKQALAVLNRFKKLHEHLKNGKTPIPEARALQETIWMCRYCEYHDRCYSETPKNDDWM